MKERSHGCVTHSTCLMSAEDKANRSFGLIKHASTGAHTDTMYTLLEVDMLKADYVVLLLNLFNFWLKTKIAIWFKIHQTVKSKWFVNKCLTTGQSPAVTFANFHGVNNLIMIDFRLPTQYHWTYHLEEKKTIDFHKLVLGSSSTSLHRGLLIIFSVTLTLWAMKIYYFS